MGPVETRLAAYGAINGLVYGMLGETSASVDRFVRLTAERGTERRWRRMGARSILEARAAIMFTMRRSIGITATRENAKMIRERLNILLEDGGLAAERNRNNGRFNAKRAQNHYANWAFGEDRAGRQF